MARRLLGPHDTLPGVLISDNVSEIRLEIVGIFPSSSNVKVVLKKLFNSSVPCISDVVIMLSGFCS